MNSKIDINVRYSEVDKMGIVYYSRYLEYFELGRANWLMSFICDYDNLEQNFKIGLPVIECGITYKKPATYPNTVQLKTTCDTSELSKIIIFNYELFLENELLVKGFSKHVFYSLEYKKIVRIPDEFNIKLKK